MDEKEAQKLAAKRLREHADDLYERMLERHSEVLPGNHHPSETLLLAHLMSSTDGYGDIQLNIGDWDKRLKPGFGTILGYCVEVGRAIVPFMLECHCEGHLRDLAVLIDYNEPNLRTPQKHQAEAALRSICSSVMVFSPEEIIADPDRCRERIEAQVFDLIEETMQDAGILQRHP